MTDWKTWLRDSDPARHAGMPAADVARIRSIVVSIANEPRSGAFAWPRSFVLTTAAFIVVCAIALVALQQNIAETRQAGIVSSAPPDTNESHRIVQKQQLQFATPGGTRIIWVFDSEFDIKGTLP